MAINSLGRMQQSYASLLTPPERASTASAGRAGQGAGGDRVTLSPAAQRAQASAATVQTPLASVERLVGGPSTEEVDGLVKASYAELLERAGRTEYLESIANPDDKSPEATAGRILGGITGYIFEAYKMQNPDMDVEKFDKFQSMVMRGFEQGLGEAKEYISAMGMLDETLAAGIDETETLVRDGLAAFFEEQRKRLTGESALEDAQPNVADTAPRATGLARAAERAGGTSRGLPGALASST